MEKIVSLISGAGKTGLLHARNEGRIYSHITWKNKLKVGLKLKYETLNYKTYRRKDKGKASRHLS